MPSNPFSYSFSVPLHDIDAAGIMFYGHLFRHAHDAYEAFMRTIGFPLDHIVREADPLLPLVHAEADYRAPLRHGEVIRVELCVARLGPRSFTLDYRFIDGDGQMRASARTVHVGLGPDRTSSAPLPQTLAAALGTRLCEDEGR
jgi:1,4-dihydroxy-2-naphthoyl-CoA hydrolase